MGHAGVTLPTGHAYSPWLVGMGENYVNVADDVADAYQIWDAGKLPFIHLMFHPTRQPDATIQHIAAGNYDTELEEWLRTLKTYCDTGRNAVVVYLPEFNGNWCVYATDDYDTDAFKTAWEQFVEMARWMGLDETMILFCWAPNDTGWLDLEDWYPGDFYVDIVGGSAYNWGGIFPNEPYETFTQLADRYVTDIRGFTGKPIVITQTGCVNDGRSAAWLDDAVYYTDTYTNIEGFIWFSIDGFRYGPGTDDFNSRVSDLDPTRPLHWFQQEEAPMGSRWADYALGELQEAFPEVRAGVWNCRKISGTNTWSQHSWGNALDLHHVGWPYEISDRNYAFLDPIYAWLKTYQEELSIRVLLWRVKDHHNHIHLDGWPKGYGQPPCDGGSLRMQYNDGRVVNGDPGPANGYTDLMDKELIVMGDAQVLEKGNSGVSVADLQKYLVTLGYDLGQWPPFDYGYPAGADGEYGQATVDAVTSYQSGRGLVMSGKADGVTLHFVREDIGYAGGGTHTHPIVIDIPGTRVTTNTGGNE